MGLEPGAIVEGKVTAITKFGAFVSLPEGKNGLVHISELSDSYVNDVNEHVSVGQQVRVYVMNIAPDGKINLSIKRAIPQAERKSTPAPRQERSRKSAPAAVALQKESSPEAEESFEDRLKKFMRESDSRIADNRMYSEHRQRSRRR